MSSNDLKRPQRIWAPQELPPSPPAEPVQSPSRAGERFGRLLHNARGESGTSSAARGSSRAGSATATVRPELLDATASNRAPTEPRKDRTGGSADEAPADDAATVALRAQPVRAKVTSPQSMSWSEAEPWCQAWRESAATTPEIEGAESQHWPHDVAATAAALCHRAGDQFTSWRVAVPLDAEALPETELWIEASPQRLSLRFRSLSAWSVRLILLHEQRLVALLQQRLGSSRDVDVEIT